MEEPVLIIYWRPVLMIALGTAAAALFGFSLLAVQTVEASGNRIAARAVDDDTVAPTRLALASPASDMPGGRSGGSDFFFGFLEFDCIPDAQGNVYGFGPIHQHDSALPELGSSHQDRQANR